MPQDQAGSVYIPQVKTPGQHDVELQEQQARQLTLTSAAEQQRAKIADEQKKAKASALWADTIKRHIDPVTGRPNYDSAITELYQTAPDIAELAEGEVIKRRSAIADAKIKDVNLKRMEFQSDADDLARIVDEDTYTIFAPRLSPGLRQAFPSFDPVRRDQLLAKAPDALANYKLVAEKIGKDPRAAIVADLANADTPEEWKATWEGYAELGVPSQDIAAFQKLYGAELTPEGLARVQAAAGQQKQTGGPTSDYSRALERYAKEKGKTADQLTFTEELEARRKYGQSDDAARRPLAPIIVMGPQGPMVTTGPDRQSVVPVTGPDGKPLPQAPTTAQRDRVESAQRATQFLDLAENLSKRINTDKGLAAKLTGSWRSLKAKANEDDDVAEYVSLIELFTPLLARAAGHTGVLTEPDYLHTIQSLPKPGDSDTLAARKMKNLRTLVGGSAPSSGAGRSGGPGAAVVPDYIYKDGKLIKNPAKGGG